MANSPLYNTEEYQAFKRAFGYNLKIARKAKGLTAAQMVYLTGYRADKYRAVEAGRKAPNLRKALAIAAVLGMRLQELVPKALTKTPAPRRKKFRVLRGKLGSVRICTFPESRRRKKKKKRPQPVEKLSRIRSRSDVMRAKAAAVKS